MQESQSNLEEKDIPSSKIFSLVTDSSFATSIA